MAARKPLQGVWRDELRDSSLPRLAKQVGLVLSTYANAGGRAWPSRSTLAAGASLSVRSVDRALARLEAAGFVEVARVRGGWTRSNQYLLCLPATATACRRSEWSTATGSPVNGDRESPQRRQGGHPKAHESALKAGALHATDALKGAAARAPLDDCGRCGTRAPLVLDDLYCIECARAWADDLVARARDQVAEIRAIVAARNGGQ